MNGGKVKSWSRIKERDWRLALGEDKVQKNWKDHFEDRQEQVAIHVCGFDGVQRGNYFRREPIRRIEIDGEATVVEEGSL